MDKRKREGSGEKPSKRRKTELQRLSEEAQLKEKKREQAEERERRLVARNKEREKLLAEVRKALSSVESAKGKGKAVALDDEPGASEKKRKRDDSEARESMEVDDATDRQERERLQEAIDYQRAEYIKFFRKYDEKTNSILEQLPGVLEHLHDYLKEDGSPKKMKLGLDSEKEKELGLNEQDGARMLDWERSAGIADFPIPYLIKRLEKEIRTLHENYEKYEEDEKNGIANENARKIVKTEKEGIVTALKTFDKYKAYLTSLQEILQKQYEELERVLKKYKDKRNELRNLPNLPNLQSELSKKYQGYLTFTNELPLPPQAKDLLLQRYQDSLDPKVVSPLILSMSNKLVEQANETVFDETIAEMQELQKRVAEDLGLENFQHGDNFFLNSQKYETDYYSRHTNLVLLQQKGDNCGKVCVQMVAADKDNRYSERSLQDGQNELRSLAAADKEHASGAAKILYAFDCLPPQPGYSPGEGETWAIMHPIVLRRIGHPIKYELLWSENIFHKWGYSAYDPTSPLYQEYSSTGSDPRNTTVDQFKSAISQKSKEEPIIVRISRKRTDVYPGSTKYEHNHFIIIDAIETINGEERIMYRDPALGKGCQLQRLLGGLGWRSRYSLAGIIVSNFGFRTHSQNFMFRLSRS
ncbi:MAG TPA: hypothetical protein VGL94_11640 [Ktedonobacteraceae bacterium]|jgi:hypothetical protein